MKKWKAKQKKKPNHIPHGISTKALISHDKLIVCVCIYSVDISICISDSTSWNFGYMKKAEHAHH